MIEGEIHGSGVLTLSDGSGAHARIELAGEGWRPFVVRDTGLVQPRFTLRLEPLGKEGALWRGLHARVAWPCPDEAALRAEIRNCLAQVVEPWLEHGLDDGGPRKTSFVTHVIDAVTGERLQTIPGGFHPFWDQLWRASRAVDEPRWEAAFERFASDFLELGLDPVTGLPCLWDGERDQPLADTSVEIALPLGFLIDLADHGPQKLRARARAAAWKIGTTVLEQGVMPDGSVAAKYFPATAKVDPGVVALRRFDVPAQLARLSSREEDPRYLKAAGEALATFEFTHAWSGA
ncbi:MAG: hypothetical protein IPJ19_21510 [Planctomycetes bacterium]|nr:hypothetical protein [Planctomycetota bacterium]